VAASYILHIDCFEHFSPDAGDISTALRIHLPLYALEGLVLLPTYVRDAEPGGGAAEQQQGQQEQPETEAAASAGLDPGAGAGRDAAEGSDLPAAPAAAAAGAGTIPRALVHSVLDILGASADDQEQGNSASAGASPGGSPLQQLRTSLAIYQLTYVRRAASQPARMPHPRSPLCRTHPTPTPNSTTLATRCTLNPPPPRAGGRRGGRAAQLGPGAGC
jgi:hypothetical protein